MSSAKPSIPCPYCGEYNDSKKHFCWICRSPLGSTRGEVDDSSLVESRLPESPPLLGSSIVLTATLLLVILGAGLLWPGVGIALAIVLVIPFVRTAMVASRRAAKGSQDAFPITISLFLGSMVTTFVILTVVGVVAFGTFCLTCFGIAVSTDDTEYAIVGSAVLSLVILTPICIRLGKWVKRRWRRDVGPA